MLFVHAEQLGVADEGSWMPYGSLYRYESDGLLSCTASR